MTSYIHLERVFLYKKLSTFPASNIVFYHYLVCKSFPLSPFVFLKLRFGALFGKFIAPLPVVKAMPHGIRIKSHDHIRPTDIFGTLWQKTKNCERSLLPVFGIKIEINLFKRCFSGGKFCKVLELRAATVNKQSMRFLKAPTLTSFQFFCEILKRYSKCGFFIPSLLSFFHVYRQLLSLPLTSRTKEKIWPPFSLYYKPGQKKFSEGQ